MLLKAEHELSCGDDRALWPSLFGAVAELRELQMPRKGLEPWIAIGDKYGLAIAQNPILQRQSEVPVG